MNILITGSEGNIARYLIPKLKDKGFNENTIYGIDKKDKVSTNNYTYINDDLTNPNYLNEILPKVNYVIHNASNLYGIGGINKNHADILTENILMTQNLFKNIKKCNNIKKVVYLSSSVVYENNSTCKEDEFYNSLLPRSGYSLSKIADEKTCEFYKKQYGINYVIWRLFNVIVPYKKNPNDYQGKNHVFVDFIYNIVVNKNRNLQFLGDGNQKRSFVWVNDVVECIANYSFLDTTNNESYNIGSSEQINMKELACVITDVAYKNNYIDFSSNDLEFQTSNDNEFDVYNRKIDLTKTKRELGWEAITSLEYSIENCIDYIKGSII